MVEAASSLTWTRCRFAHTWLTHHDQYESLSHTHTHTHTHTNIYGIEFTTRVRLIHAGNNGLPGPPVARPPSTECRISIYPCPVYFSHSPSACIYLVKVRGSWPLVFPLMRAKATTLRVGMQVKPFPRSKPQEECLAQRSNQVLPGVSGKSH